MSQVVSIVPQDEIPIPAFSHMEMEVNSYIREDTGETSGWLKIIILKGN